jgi:hypothetical protein
VPEQLLTVLKLCLLALLYLFFLRVLRAVWTEVRPPRMIPAATRAPVGGPPATGGRTRGRGRSGKARRRQAVPTRLVVVEPPARAGAEYPLGPELTVGRAPGCSLVFDEQYVSQVHARIFVRDGSVFVEDLGSTNGTWVNGARALGQMPARIGDRIQVGNIVLEVR